MSQYRFTLNTIEWELEHIINLSLITIVSHYFRKNDINVKTGDLKFNITV